jgi:hypothetical protein
VRFASALAITALFLGTCVSPSAAAQTEIEEVNATKKQALLVVLAHAYADQIPRGRILKFIIDAQINGLRTHKEILLKPDRVGGITCDYAVDIIDANYVEISAFTSAGDFRKRFPNVFYDRAFRRVALACRSGLKTIVRAAEGEPVYLFAGPFPKVEKTQERKRLLKHYEKTNYILLRLT